MSQSEARCYVIQAQSTETFGRVRCQARDRQFLVDGPVQNGCLGIEVTPAEVFLAGVAACGVELLQVIAKEQQLPVQAIDVQISGTIDRSKPVRPDVTLFNSVHVEFAIAGVSVEKANELVDRFKRR
jgi:uncharacterized OsmC-like protein